MSKTINRRLRVITGMYWILLLYIIAALVWWFISLEKQNRQMSMLRTADLRVTMDSIAKPVLYSNELKKITLETRRKSAQYIGEGLTFMLLILLGAWFVYRAVRKQITLTEQQQNFMMAVTHELKTPIAVMQLNLETMQQRTLEKSLQDKLIGTTLQENQRLNTLTNNILIASQLDVGGYKVAEEELNFSDLVDDSVNNFIARFPKRVIRGNIEPGIYVKGDFLLLQMLVNNLIENALKYSPKESPVDCELLQTNQKAILRIKDKGPGISDSEKKRVFEKFYRIGSENTRKTQGTGLGLYLGRKITEQHRGEIFITDNLPSGSIFVLHLTTLPT
jgi:two-component system, OmpR family, sensor histidine kinase CiaH